MILQIIKDIEKEKEGKIAPSFALYRDVVRRSNMTQKQVNSEINALIKSGTIKYGNTINDRWLSLVRK